MGSIRRKTFTKPLPEGAELFTRKGETFAKWRTAVGKMRTALPTERPVTMIGDISMDGRHAKANAMEFVTPKGCDHKAQGCERSELPCVAERRPRYPEGVRS